MPIVQSDLDKPKLDEIEICLFGPGFGESVLVHLKNNEWLIVDSCKSSFDDEPDPIKYLKSIGVDISNDVKLVVASHWDDDHILGLSNIAEQCTNARFYFSSAFNDSKFLQLVIDSPYSKRIHGGLSGGFYEMSETFRILTEREVHPILLQQNSIVFNKLNNYEILALSPPPSVVNQAVSSLLNKVNSRITLCQKVTPPKPNDTSIVVHVKFANSLNILLGGDLEQSGWNLILNDETSMNIKKNSLVFKVPHHGSQNAHHDDVWDKLLETNCHAILTGFNRGKKPLPSDEDITRITSLTQNVFSTVNPSQKGKKLKTDDKRFDMNLKARNAKILHKEYNFIRLRYNETTGIITQSLFGSSTKLEAK